MWDRVRETLCWPRLNFQGRSVEHMEVPKCAVGTSCEAQIGEPPHLLPCLAPQTFVEQEQLLKEACQITHVRGKYYLATERRRNIRCMTLPVSLKRFSDNFGLFWLCLPWYGASVPAALCVPALAPWALFTLHCMNTLQAYSVYVSAGCYTHSLLEATQSNSWVTICMKNVCGFIIMQKVSDTPARTNETFLEKTDLPFAILNICSLFSCTLHHFTTLGTSTLPWEGLCHPISFSSLNKCSGNKLNLKQHETG